MTQRISRVDGETEVSAAKAVEITVKYTTGQTAEISATPSTAEYMVTLYDQAGTKVHALKAPANQGTVSGKIQLDGPTGEVYVRYQMPASNVHSVQYNVKA